MNTYYSKPLLTLPAGTIFVFGSNLSGFHGAGAALTALKQFGAVYGIGIGLQGRSYGIPTKDYRIRTLPLNAITEHVNEFIKFTHSNDYMYYVTPIGTGLAGYIHDVIAPMFKGAKNCMFPIEWQRFL